MSDARVLNALAEELDVDLRLGTVEQARAELLRLEKSTARPPAPSVDGARPQPPESGEALLATWAELIDDGRMLVGDEFLAGTAKPARAVISPATAAQVGVADGGSVAVSTDAGTLALPVVIDESCADGVVWIPATARDHPVRRTLGVGSGATVRLTSGDAPPVIGTGDDA
jgi:NADH-quinone oxidoreductase subunit G